MGRMLVLALILCGLGVTLWIVLDEDGDSIDSDIEGVEGADEVEEQAPPPKKRRPRSNRRTRTSKAARPPAQPAGSVPPPPPPTGPATPAPTSTEEAATPAAPANKPALVKRPVVELDQAHEWQEGESTKKAYLDPRVLVEFAPKSDEAKNPIAPVLGAQLISDGHPRMWLLEEIGDTSEDLGAQATAKAQLSPLLHDGTSTTSARRAPTGRLHMKLDAEWDKEAVEDFATRHDLSDVKRALVRPGYWDVYAGPGIASLSKATALRQLDEVLDCQVDWWQAGARK